MKNTTKCLESIDTAVQLQNLSTKRYIILKLMLFLLNICRMVMVWCEVTTYLCSWSSQLDCQKHPSNNTCLTIWFAIKAVQVLIIFFSFLKVWIQSWNDTSCFSWLKQKYCQGIWWVAVNQCPKPYKWNAAIFMTLLKASLYWFLYKSLLSMWIIMEFGIY